MRWNLKTIYTGFKNKQRPSEIELCTMTDFNAHDRVVTKVGQLWLNFGSVEANHTFYRESWKSWSYEEVWRTFAVDRHLNIGGCSQTFWNLSSCEKFLRDQYKSVWQQTVDYSLFVKFKQKLERVRNIYKLSNPSKDSQKSSNDLWKALWSFKRLFLVTMQIFVWKQLKTPAEKINYRLISLVAWQSGWVCFNVLTFRNILA